MEGVHEFILFRQIEVFADFQIESDPILRIFVDKKVLIYDKMQPLTKFFTSIINMVKRRPWGFIVELMI